MSFLTVLNIGDIDETTPGDLTKAGDGAKAIRQVKSSVKTAFPGIDDEVLISNEKLNHIDAHFDFDNDEIEMLDSNYKPEINVRKTLEIDEAGELKLANMLGGLGLISLFNLDFNIIESAFPGRFMLCNGEMLPIDSQLAILLERTDPDNPFVLPDYRGVSARGHDPRPYADDYLTNDESGRNPDNSALGDFQDDAVGDHEHSFSLALTTTSKPNTSAGTALSTYYVPSTYEQITNLISSPKTNIETRKKSVILNYVIRIN